MKAYMYILECSNGNYYTGSTKDLEKRLAQHQAGEGANFTKKHLPVKLVYFIGRPLNPLRGLYGAAKYRLKVII